MFFNKKDDEADFCESYKSQVLGTDSTPKHTSVFGTILKSLTILILLVIVIAISIYGYNYFMQQIKEEVLPLPPVSIQISDEDLVVEDEDTSLESDLIIKAEDNKSVPAVIPTQNEEPKMDENSSAMKSQEKSLEVPTPTQEANYLEDLAKLAEEIDKENKQ